MATEIWTWIPSWIYWGIENVWSTLLKFCRSWRTEGTRESGGTASLVASKRWRQTSWDWCSIVGFVLSSLTFGFLSHVPFISFLPILSQVVSSLRSPLGSSTMVSSGMASSMATEKCTGSWTRIPVRSTSESSRITPWMDMERWSERIGEGWEEGRGYCERE